MARGPEIASNLVNFVKKHPWESIGCGFGTVSIIDLAYSISRLTRGNLLESMIGCFPALALASAACSLTEEGILPGHHVSTLRKIAASGAGIGGGVAFAMWYSGNPNLLIPSQLLGAVSSIVGTINYTGQSKEFFRIHKP